MLSLLFPLLLWSLIDANQTHASASNDQRLMQETPDILALSNALEQPAVQYISHGVVFIGGTIGGVLAAARRSLAAIMVTAVWILCQTVVVNMIL